MRQIPARIRGIHPTLAVCCAAAIFALAACGDSSSPSNDVTPEMDAASEMDASSDTSMDMQEMIEPTFELTVGTGQNAFEPLDAAGELVLERGPQGLQHVYVSLRAPLAEGFHTIDLSITVGERVISAPTRVNAPFLSVPGEDFVEMVGQLVVVPEPNGALGVPGTLRAQVEPSGGGFGLVDREVQVRW